MFLWNLLFLAIQVIPICLFSFHPWIIRNIIPIYLPLSRHLNLVSLRKYLSKLFHFHSKFSHYSRLVGQL